MAHNPDFDLLRVPSIRLGRYPHRMASPACPNMGCPAVWSYESSAT